MTDVTFEEVAKLADRLSPEDRQALIAHLQERSQQRELSFEEWEVLYDSLKVSTPVLQDFSNRRED